VLLFSAPGRLCRLIAGGGNCFSDLRSTRSEGRSTQATLITACSCTKVIRALRPYHTAMPSVLSAAIRARTSWRAIVSSFSFGRRNLPFGKIAISIMLMQKAENAAGKRSDIVFRKSNRSYLHSILRSTDMNGGRSDCSQAPQSASGGWRELRRQWQAAFAVFIRPNALAVVRLMTKSNLIGCPAAPPASTQPRICPA
jgi:hypothetical protein